MSLQQRINTMCRKMDSKVQSEKELDLITAILAGRAQLYHQLIRPYERSVYRISLSCMKNQRDAEDVARKTFVSAFRDLSVFPRQAKFGNWLMGITLSEAANHFEQEPASKMTPVESDSEISPASPAPVEDWRLLPSSMVEREEVRNLIHQAIGRLPRLDRLVFILRDLEKLNVDEIAQVLAIKVANAGAASHRARIMLQRMLATELRDLHRA